VSTSYDGRQYVGIDLHRRRSVLVRMTETGETLETVRVSNDPEYLQQVMARAGIAPEVALEACYGWVRREGAGVKREAPVGGSTDVEGVVPGASARWPVSASACVVGNRGVRSPG
jgi:hypothetical protein